ncbi:MAG: ComEC/Rec2 family competence protein [Patescibacteria group bacterium]
MNTFAKKARFGTLAVLFFANFFIWSALLAEERGGELKVAFLDIGQGDAIYIEAPNGNQVLIDGGPGKALLSRLGEVMPAYDRSVDLLIVSNPDKDHIAGFIEVLKSFVVAAVMEPGTKPETAIYQEFEKAVETENAQKILGRRGQIVWLDRARGVHFDIFFPDQDVADWQTNDGSIIGKLVYGDTCIIFPGDAPQSMENYVVAFDGATLHCQVLKVGHHGSRTSSGVAFVGTVAPEYAVISSGKGNSYGHPHQETMDTLSRFGAKILRTDQLGTIIFTSDGQSFQIK